MPLGCSFFAINKGSPILTPNFLASREREITHPSLLEITETGFPFNSGLTFCSQQTKNESQSTNAITFLFLLITITVSYIIRITSIPIRQCGQL